MVRRMSFFALVSALETLHAQTNCKRIGESVSAQTENVRFFADASLAFPISDTKSLSEPSKDWPYFTVTTSFLSLVGSTTPIPLLYTREILEDAENGPTRHALLNVLHHRVISLFYRAWKKYRHVARFREDCSDPHSRLLLSLAGFGSAEAIEATRLPAT